MAGSRWKSRYSNNNEESVAQRVIQLNLLSAFAGEANACLRASMGKGSRFFDNYSMYGLSGFG
ncbi:hypothetical protein CsSME_00021872 [Camellia sinensis var. sinensis]